jgi:hypothetical protein
LPQLEDKALLRGQTLGQRHLVSVNINFVNWIGELVAGIGAVILMFILAILWLAPSAVIGFLPKLWRTWKGKRI